MLLDALSQTAHDLAIGLAAGLVLLLLGYLIVRSNLRLKEREAALRQKESEEVVPAFSGPLDWPPKRGDPHPRSHEAIVPRAGRKAA
jgi:hypothetical protein